MITYSSLTAAVTAIGSSEKSVLITAGETLSANLTIPSTMQVTFTKGAIITLGDYNLTINGPFTAGLYQVFNQNGTGRVTFASGSVSEVHYQWFNSDSVAIASVTSLTNYILYLSDLTILAGDQRIGTYTGALDPQSRLDVRSNIESPTSIHPNLQSIIEGKGDNTTHIGVEAGYFQARDRTDVTGVNKGVLFGVRSDVMPIVDRDNIPYDDVAVWVGANIGTKKGTDFFYGVHNAGISGPEFITIFSIDTYADVLFTSTGQYIRGIDLSFAVFSDHNAILLQNADKIVARNTEATYSNLIHLNASDRVVIGDSGKVSIPSLSIYADNAAALAGGLVADDLYKTATGQLMIVYTP